MIGTIVDNNGQTALQLALQLQRAFQVKVTFRQIMEQYGTAAQLAAHLDAGRAPAAPAATTTSLQPAAATRPAATPGDEEGGEGPMSYDVKKAFGAIARIHTRADAMTPRQRTRLDALIARYVARTGKSKAYTAQHRARMADPRVVNGFRPMTKEITYQIVIERSKGSRMWDIDGNEYVDALNGFGMSLFGWQPDFVLDAACRQLKLWQARGEAFADLSMQVNVSGNDLAHSGFAQRVTRALVAARLHPSQLTLELTENVLMDRVDGAVVPRAHRSAAHARPVAVLAIGADAVGRLEGLDGRLGARPVGAVDIHRHADGVQVLLQGGDLGSDGTADQQHDASLGDGGGTLARGAPPPGAVDTARKEVGCSRVIEAGTPHLRAAGLGRRPHRRPSGEGEKEAGYWR